MLGILPSELVSLIIGSLWVVLRASKTEAPMERKGIRSCIFDIPVQPSRNEAAQVVVTILFTRVMTFSFFIFLSSHFLEGLRVQSDEPPDGIDKV